ncbi:MAG: hypothetical protein O7G29_09570, partial [Acidobacteria bacterium]|nr:hypothetical protein [Acidobacteriota bacterium]
GNLRYRALLQDLTLSIQGVRPLSELEFGKILLVTGLEETGQTSSWSQEKEQYTTGQGIKSSRVADLGPCKGPDSCHDIMRCWT